MKKEFPSFLTHCTVWYNITIQSVTCEICSNSVARLKKKKKETENIEVENKVSILGVESLLPFCANSLALLIILLAKSLQNEVHTSHKSVTMAPYL